MATFLEEEIETTWNDSYTYSGHGSWGGQRIYLKWQLYLFGHLEEDSETTWNDSYTYSCHGSWGGQRNYLKLPILAMVLEDSSELLEMTAIANMAMFLDEDINLPEMTALTIITMFLGEDSETTWNDSYSCYGNISWGGQWNYLKWQLYLLWPSFLRRTAKLPEMTDIPIVAIFLEEDSETTWNESYTYYDPCFLGRTVKLPGMTSIPIMAMFLKKDSETTWNDSYTYSAHVSWGEQRNYIPIIVMFLEEDSETTWHDIYTYYGHVSWRGKLNNLKW